MLRKMLNNAPIRIDIVFFIDESVVVIIIAPVDCS